MFRMATFALKPALIVASMGFAVGEFVAPHTEQLAMSYRALAQRSESSVAGRFGAWNRDGNTFVHVDAVQRGGVAYGGVFNQQLSFLDAELKKVIEKVEIEEVGPLRLDLQRNSA